jgi:hypothetical protein
MACWRGLADPQNRRRLQNQARSQARICFLGNLGGGRHRQHLDSAGRWRHRAALVFLAQHRLPQPVPVLTALFGILEWRAIADRKSELSPFIYAVLLFTLSYLGIAISLFPMIVPHHYDLWQAASSPDTQIFLGVGTLFPAAGDPCLYRLVLLGVPGQGARRYRISTSYQCMQDCSCHRRGQAAGTAIALDLAAQGWNVAIHYNSSEEELTAPPKRYAPLAPKRRP